MSESKNFKAPTQAYYDIRADMDDDWRVSGKLLITALNTVFESQGTIAYIVNKSALIIPTAKHPIGSRGFVWKQEGQTTGVGEENFYIAYGLLYDFEHPGTGEPRRDGFHYITDTPGEGLDLIPISDPQIVRQLIADWNWAVDLASRVQRTAEKKILHEVGVESSPILATLRDGVSGEAPKEGEIVCINGNVVAKYTGKTMAEWFKLDGKEVYVDHEGFDEI